MKKDGSDNVAYQNISLVMTKPLAKDFMDRINSIVVKILNPTAAKLTTDEIDIITQVKGPIYRYMLSSTTMLHQPNIDDPLLKDYMGALGEQIVAERMAELVGKIRTNMAHGKYSVGEDKEKIRFLANVEKTQIAFLHMGINAEQRMASMQKMQESTSLYEKALVSNMTSKMAARMRFGG